MTTLEAQQRPMTYGPALDAAISEYVMLKDAVKVTRQRMGELEMSIRAALQAENATQYPHEECNVSLKPGDPYYPVDRVLATVAELLLPADRAKLLPTPGPCKSCQGTGQAPQRVDGVQANRIRKYGDQYADALDACCLRGDPQLVIEAKPKKGAAA